MTLDELKNIIINNLHILLRKNKDVTLKSLSRAIDASDSYMQKVMSGNCIPTLEKLVAISNFFDVPLAVLITPNNDVSQEVQIASDKLKKLSPDAVHIAHAQINYMYIAESNPYNKK